MVPGALLGPAGPWVPQCFWHFFSTFRHRGGAPPLRNDTRTPEVLKSGICLQRMREQGNAHDPRRHRPDGRWGCRMDYLQAALVAILTHRFSVGRSSSVGSPPSWGRNSILTGAISGSVARNGERIVGQSRAWGLQGVRQLRCERSRI